MYWNYHKYLTELKEPHRSNTYKYIFSLFYNTHKHIISYIPNRTVMEFLWNFRTIYTQIQLNIESRTFVNRPPTTVKLYLALNHLFHMNWLKDKFCSSQRKSELCIFCNTFLSEKANPSNNHVYALKRLLKFFDESNL